MLSHFTSTTANCCLQRRVNSSGSYFYCHVVDYRVPFSIIRIDAGEND
jgi:hypothetical protein